MSSQLHYQIAMTMIPQVGIVTAKNLIAYCGNAEAVFRAKAKELRQIPGINDVVIKNLLEIEPLLVAEKELNFIEKHQITPLFYTDARYPTRLKARVDSPVVLYAKASDLTLLEAPRIVGIVGTRQPSDTAKALCEELVEGLQAYGVVVVSGLAYGIDVTAHRKANTVGVPNFGVLGHGLGSIYPASHQSVANKMIENGGLLTEYAHHEGPDREHFPMRNRIISGMSDALVVVETAISGGSMISADFATKQHVDLFAMPGRPKDPKCAGCNALIKTNRAQLIESAEDLAEAMRWELNGRSAGLQAQLFLDLSPNENKVITLIREQPQIAIDALAIGTNIPAGELAAIILSLEFKGVVRTQPGKRYIAV
jgi:DNA processing protein